MKLTSDEHRALSFITALLCLSAAVRIVGLPEPVEAPGEGGADLAAHIRAVEDAVEEATAMDRPLEPDETIDPNTAPAGELARLPRVGPALAGRIVASRESDGRYRSLADLGRVRGIGERTLELLAPHVPLRATAPSTVAPSTPAGRPTFRRGTGAAGRASGPAGDGPGPIDINRASAGELTALHGVGPVLAERIVAHRDSAGPFRTVSALAAVKGIGPATLSGFEDRVVVR